MSKPSLLFLTLLAPVLSSAADKVALAKLFTDLRPGMTVEVPTGTHHVSGSLTSAPTNPKAGSSTPSGRK